MRTTLTRWPCRTWRLSLALYVLAAAAGNSESQASPPDDADAAEVKAVAAEAEELTRLLLESTRGGQTIAETPSIVTVITADQLDALGFRTLEELLQYTAGFGVARVPWLLDSPRTRGVPNAALVLINGTPVVSSNLNAISLGYGVDIDTVNRVEIFSTPGGVLWGAHAWLGVVNIITKDGQRNPGASARVRLGSFGLQKYSLAYGGAIGPVTVYTHGSLTLERGGNLLVHGPLVDFSDFGGVAIWDTANRLTLNRQSYFGELSARAQLGDLELYGRLAVENQYHSLTGELEPLYDGTTSELAQPVSMVHLSYAPRWDRWSLLLKAAYLEEPTRWFSRMGGGIGTLLRDVATIETGFHRPSFVAELSRSDTIAGWLKNDATVGGELSLTLLRDSTIEAQLTGIPGKQPWLRDATITLGSAYVYDELRVGERVIVSAGARVNGASEDYYQPAVLLKGDAIVKLARGLHLKLNYDEGMRPPSLEAARGSSFWFQALRNPKVERSRVLSSELRYQRRFSSGGPLRSLELSAGYAFIHLTDVIGRVPSEIVAYAWKYTVLGEPLDIHALQAEARLGLSRGVDVWARASHEEMAEIAFLPFTRGPSTMLAVGGSYRPTPWLDLALRARLLPPFGGQFFYRTDNAAGGTQTNANQARFELPTTVELAATVRLRFRGWAFQLAAYNLADTRAEDINQELILGAAPAVVPKEGRSVHALLSYTY